MKPVAEHWRRHFPTGGRKARDSHGRAAIAVVFGAEASESCQRESASPSQREGSHCTVPAFAAAAAPAAAAVAAATPHRRVHRLPTLNTHLTAAAIPTTKVAGVAAGGRAKLLRCFLPPLHRQQLPARTRLAVEAEGPPGGRCRRGHSRAMRKGPGSFRPVPRDGFTLPVAVTTLLVGGCGVGTRGGSFRLLILHHACERACGSGTRCLLAGPAVADVASRQPGLALPVAFKDWYDRGLSVGDGDKKVSAAGEDGV